MFSFELKLKLLFWSSELPLVNKLFREAQQLTGLYGSSHTEPLTEMSTRNLSGGKGWAVRGADNISAICEQIV
jgi:hypothetical protein